MKRTLLKAASAAVAAYLAWAATDAGKTALAMFPFPVASNYKAPAGHRYWQIYVTANNGGSLTEIADLFFWDSDSVLGTAASASASSTFSGRPASQAIDGDLNTSWDSSDSSVPQYLTCDFGVGVTKDIRGVRITAPPFSADLTRSPKDFAVRYSDDGSTWTTAWSVTGATGWSLSETRNFYKSGFTPSYSGSPFAAASYWRVYITAVSGFPAFAEIEMRATTGGATQCTGGTASASSIFNGSYVAANAVDGNGATAWSASGGAPAWWRYDFASPVKVGQVMIKARTDSPSTTPQGFAVQYSNNGTTWVTAWTVSGQTGWTAGEVRTLTDPLYV